MRSLFFYVFLGLSLEPMTVSAADFSVKGVKPGMNENQAVAALPPDLQKFAVVSPVVVADKAERFQIKAMVPCEGTRRSEAHCTYVELSGFVDERDNGKIYYIEYNQPVSDEIGVKALEGRLVEEYGPIAYTEKQLHSDTWDYWFSDDPHAKTKEKFNRRNFYRDSVIGASGQGAFTKPVIRVSVDARNQLVSRFTVSLFDPDLALELASADKRAAAYAINRRMQSGADKAKSLQLR